MFDSYRNIALIDLCIVIAEKHEYLVKKRHLLANFQQKLHFLQMSLSTTTKRL